MAGFCCIFFLYVPSFVNVNTMYFGCACAKPLRSELHELFAIIFRERQVGNPSISAHLVEIKVNEEASCCNSTIIPLQRSGIDDTELNNNALVHTRYQGLLPRRLRESE